MRAKGEVAPIGTAEIQTVQADEANAVVLVRVPRAGTANAETAKHREELIRDRLSQGQAGELAEEQSIVTLCLLMSFHFCEK